MGNMLSPASSSSAGAMGAISPSASTATSIPMEQGVSPTLANTGTISSGASSNPSSGLTSPTLTNPNAAPSQISLSDPATAANSVLSNNPQLLSSLLNNQNTSTPGLTGLDIYGGNMGPNFLLSSLMGQSQQG